MSTLDTINIWAAPNDNTGDTIRAWWQKINDNFSALNTDKLETSSYTAADVKSKYESNADTNAFTDADESKLDWITAWADMLKSVYDTDSSWVVDNSEALEWKTLDEVKDVNKTWFDRRNSVTMWVIELSPDWTTIYWVRADWTTYTNASWNFANWTAFQAVATARTLAIFPSSWQTEFSFYVQNTKYTKTALESIVLTDTTWMRVAAYDNTWTLIETFTPTQYDIFTWYAFVSVVYWNAVTQELVLFWDERHWIEMDAATHYYEHMSEWARYVSWLWMNWLAAWSWVYTSISSWVMFDEDIINNVPTQTNSPFWYLDWAAWRISPDWLDLAYMWISNPYFNEEITPWVFQLTEIANTNYCLIHFFATNDRIFPVWKVLWQAEYSTIPAARAWAYTELSDLYLSWVPTPEAKPIATVIVDDAGQLVLTDTWDTYIDWRETKITWSGWTSWVTNLHADLTDTATNWHPADIISYNNATSWLTATEVQSAIDEVVTDIPDNTDFVDLTTTQTVGWPKTFSETLTTAVNASIWTHLSAWSYISAVSYLETWEIATPATPASWKGKIYFKTDWKAYSLNDGWTETELGWGWGWTWVSIYNWAVAWEQVVWDVFEAPSDWTFTATTFRISLWTLPTWANFIAKLYKNGTEDASATIATTDTATNWLYQATDTTFVSWSYVATDRITVSITQVWSTVPWSNFTWSIS